MTDAPALTLRRVVIRAASSADADLTLAAFRAGMARPLAKEPGWSGGSRAALSLHAPVAEAGTAAAAAVRRAVTGGAGG